MKALERIRAETLRAASQLPPEEFIDRFCIVEDRDAPELVRPFRLWPEQKELVRSLHTHDRNIVLKARQLGVSWICIAYAFRMMLFSPGYSVLALSRTETEAREMTRRMGVLCGAVPQFLRPKNWGGPVYSLSADTVRISRPGGADSVFHALASGRDAGRGFTASLLLIDEWAFQQFARSIWLAIYPAINRVGGGKLIGVSTMERGSLFEELYFDETNGFNRLFLSWRADPRRTEEWYRATRAELGDRILQEYPETPEDAVTIPGGAFFPELRAETHDAVRPLSGGERIYAALDYGLDRLACLWIAIFSDGTEHVFRELCVSDRIASEAAEEILRAGEGLTVYEYLAPPDLWNTDRHTGKSTAEIFSDYGVELVRTNNARVHGWMDLKEHLAVRERKHAQSGETISAPTLTIDRAACSELWFCLSRIQRDPRHPGDVASEPHALTHAPDALRAFCAGRPVPAARPREIKLKERLGGIRISTHI